MPTTIEELEATIQDTISQANSILFVNHNILEQYEDRQRQVLFILVVCFGLFPFSSIFTVTFQIEDLATKLEADKKESRRCLAELDNIKV